MVFFMIILLIIIFSGARLCGPEGFNDDYLDKKSTTAVNGIFVMLVLFSHYAQYADLGGIYDEPYLAVREHLNQLVVATFMFYSGYGMMEAIKNRGIGYVRKILSKFWQLLLKFDIAVVFFLAVNTLLGIRFPLGQTLLAFTTWTAIGNSNWYITAILILYVIMYLSFTAGLIIFKSNEKEGRLMGLVLTFLLTATAVYMQIRIGRPAYCYDTMMLLPIGCLYSELRPRIENFVMRNDIMYLVTFTAVTGIYMVSFFHRWSWGIAAYTVWAASFMLLVLLVTMKVSIYNGFLEWAGKHIFGIYILQRLPMTVLDKMGYIDDHKYMSLVASIIITFAIAAIFQKSTDRLITLMTGRHIAGTSGRHEREAK